MKNLLFVLFVFISRIVMADEYITQNIINGCGEAGRYKAIFEPLIFNCTEGSFLPANTLECVSCPNDFTCPGGLYMADDRKNQGLNYNNLLAHDANNVCAMNFEQNFTAVFEKSIYTCSSGYYLPANVDSCTICPQDSYCTGGTYTFNETNNQGIEPCADGTFAPGGTSYCYEHILHIGDDVVYLKSTKLTTPSLNVGMDDGIFYANMTTTPTPMNSGTEHFLKIEYDGMIYYVCDDTTYGK